MATSIGSVGTVEPFNRDTDNWTTIVKDSESVSQFVAELRKLSEFCEFGDTLDVMLRDRLVCGVRNQKLQQRLLAESNLTFTKAFGIAQTAELSEQNAKDLQREETMEVGRLQQLWKTRAHCSGMPTKSGGGGDRHPAPGGPGRQKVPAKSKGKTKQDSPEPLPTDTLYCFRSPDPLKAPVKINNVTIVMEVDTGAAASVISERTYKNSWVGVPRPPLLPTDVLLRTYSGERLDIRGEIKVELEQESKKYVTISTHKGLFQYSRLPFGVASAPAIFQHTMENILQGIPDVLVYLDDILVAGSSEAEHMQLLEIVLAKLENAGIRLKRSKCHFMLPSIQYLGHHISAEGIRPADDKKRAVLDAPVPQNVPQLRSFLGLVNFYGKFLHNLADTLAPLHQLLRKTNVGTGDNSKEKL
ncbi:hypothetical protein EMCRGX_G007263 [Ephydatia muelleri]